MDKKEIMRAVQYVRARSKKRKFDQSIDLTVNFKGLDLKKPENAIELDVKFPHSTGKQAEAKALIFLKDKAFAREITGKVAKIIMDTDVPNLKKKDIEAIVRDYNVLLAEGPALLVVAKHLGQQLAPKGKMPKLVQPNLQNIETAMQNVSTFTKISNKKGKAVPLVHVTIGKESNKDEEIVDNAMTAIDSIVAALPGKEGNLKSVLFKTTMGPSVKVGQTYDNEPEVKKEVKK